MGGGTSPSVRMERFNHRDDTVALNTNSGYGTENGNWSQNVDTIFRLRVQFNDTASSTKTSNYTFGLEFEINGVGGFTAVGAATALQSANSAQFADDDAVTSAHLTAGAGSFVNGVGDENGAAPSAGNITLGNGNGHTECEFALSIDSAQVANNDTIEVRATGTDAAAAVTATITVIEAVAVSGIAHARVGLRGQDLAAKTAAASALARLGLRGAALGNTGAPPITVSDTAFINYTDADEALSPPASMSITIPANCPGLLVLVAGDEGDGVSTTRYYVTFDPGGGNEVVLTTVDGQYEHRQQDPIGANVALIFLFKAHQLPPAGGTFTIEVLCTYDSVTGFVVAGAIALGSAPGWSAATRQTAGESLNSSTTTTPTFAGNIQSGSLVAEVVSGGSDPRTFTCSDLATEIIDDSDPSLAANSAVVAYEIDPVELQAYEVVSSGSQNRQASAIIEIVLAKPGFAHLRVGLRGAARIAGVRAGVTYASASYVVGSSADSGSVSWPTTQDGLLVIVSNEQWYENIQVVFDPGGGNEVTKLFADRVNGINESGTQVSAYFFSKDELPAGAGTYTVEVNFNAGPDNPSSFAFAAIPIITGGRGAHVRATATNSILSSDTLTVSLASPAAADSLIAMPAATSSLNTFTFDDLATELYDVQRSSEAGAGAYEPEPIESQNYVVNTSITVGRLVGLVVEVAPGPGYVARIRIALRSLGVAGKTSTAQALARIATRFAGGEGAAPFVTSIRLGLRALALSSFSKGGTARASMGLRGYSTETTSRTGTAHARLGLRAHDLAQKTASAIAHARLGLRAFGDYTLTAVVQGIAHARLGLRAIGQAAKTASATPLARIGLRGLALGAKTASAQSLTRLGLRALSQASKAAQGIAAASIGLRAFITGTTAAVVTGLAHVRLAIRSLDLASKTITAQGSARLGVRALSAASKSVSAIASASIGLRALVVGAVITLASGIAHVRVALRSLSVASKTASSTPTARMALRAFSSSTKSVAAIALARIATRAVSVAAKTIDSVSHARAALRLVLITLPVGAALIVRKARGITGAFDPSKDVSGVFDPTKDATGTFDPDKGVDGEGDNL